MPAPTPATTAQAFCDIVPVFGPSIVASRISLSLAVCKLLLIKNEVCTENEEVRSKFIHSRFTGLCFQIILRYRYRRNDVIDRTRGRHLEKDMIR